MQVVKMLKSLSKPEYLKINNVSWVKLIMGKRYGWRKIEDFEDIIGHVNYRQQQRVDLMF